MPVDYFAGTASKDRDLKTELADRRSHSIDHVIILSWISDVVDKSCERPVLDGLRDGMREHTRTFRVEF